jgi:murein tripeptide amidase MpaA
LSTFDCRVRPLGAADRPFYRVGGEWQRTDAAHITPEGCAFVVPAGESTELAWYHPYSIGSYAEWLGRISGHSSVTTTNLGTSHLDRVVLGVADQPTVVVIGRQHPGESMASFCVEGLVSTLLLAADADGGLPIHAVIVPIMNPSGVAEGRHRLSSALVDYNRSWSSERESPEEVEKVRGLLGGLPRLDLFLDIHGDEDAIHTCGSCRRRSSQPRVDGCRRPSSQRWAHVRHRRRCWTPVQRFGR